MAREVNPSVQMQARSKTNQFSGCSLGGNGEGRRPTCVGHGNERGTRCAPSVSPLSFFLFLCILCVLGCFWKLLVAMGFARGVCAVASSSAVAVAGISHELPRSNAPRDLPERQQCPCPIAWVSSHRYHQTHPRPHPDPYPHPHPHVLQKVKIK